MIKGVEYDVMEYDLMGYNLWDGNKKISEISNTHRKNIYNNIINACETLGIEITSGEPSFNPSDGWFMSDWWLKKYAFGFIKEIEKYF